jgi:hypothetical protein
VTVCFLDGAICEKKQKTADIKKPIEPLKKSNRKISTKTSEKIIEKPSLNKIDNQTINLSKAPSKISVMMDGWAFLGDVGNPIVKETRV